MKGATTIQERLWELRKDRGLNLEELSKLTGISKSALGNYEKEDTGVGDCKEKGILVHC